MERREKNKPKKGRLEREKERTKGNIKTDFWRMSPT